MICVLPCMMYQVDMIHVFHVFRVSFNFKENSVLLVTYLYNRSGDLQKSPQTELIIQFFYDNSCTLLHSFQIASRAALYLVIHCACQVSGLVISLSPYGVQYDIMM